MGCRFEFGRALGGVRAVGHRRAKDWTEQRRYMELEILVKARLTLLANDADRTTTTVVTDNAAFAA